MTAPGSGGGAPHVARRPSRGGVQGGRRRWGGDEGMATVEAAIALAALVTVVVACIAAVLAVGAQVRCVDAAREVARLAARGDDRAADIGRRTMPGAAIDIGGDGSAVSVTVSVDVPLLPLHISGRAVSAREPAAGA